MYRLVFLTGKFKGRRLAVHQGSILVGRDPECHIHLTDDDEVSRKHAVFEERADGVFVSDSGSLNKITVNNQEIREACLKRGDIVQLGKTRIQFQDLESTQAQESRRVGLVQRLTVASVALVLFLELVFLVGLSIWHNNEGFVPTAPVRASNAPAASVTTNSAMLPAATPTEDTSVLKDAQDRLNLLEQETVEPALPPANATNELSIVSEEIRQLRQDVADMREKVQVLESSSNAVPTVEAPATNLPPAVDPDALVQKARQMLDEAQGQARKMNLIQADQTLDRIQIMAPDFLPAYVERAQLLERRGFLKKAAEQWALVMSKSIGTPLYQQAAAEQIRISRMDMIQTALKASSGKDDDESLAKLPRRIRILSVEHQKFPDNDQYEEMRLLRITLKARPGDNDIRGNDLYVVVNFFDQGKESGQISLSETVVPKNAFTVEGELSGGAQRVITAAYIVPKGFRAEEKLQQGEERRYYGYTVRVLQRDTLQDEEAKPRSLLREQIDLPHPPPSEPAANTAIAPASEMNSVR
ncbi:MAG TPA: hypothetical protein DCZ95_03865 [Verrucomicrobia bacterium]|nr:hypothetical protein [Verrucomicrobiota bacterium]